MLDAASPTSIGTSADAREELRELAQAKNAVILAHYYQTDDIKSVADYVGDSLELAKKAATCDAENIVFAGVKFMAETAKILNPERSVYLPDPNAGCSLASSITAADVVTLKDQYPGHKVVTYINTTAEVKAESDVACTSSNAEHIVRELSKEAPLIFIPDENLAIYLERKTGIELKKWRGVCHVHQALSAEKLLELKRQYPSYEIISHPEAHLTILEISDFIGSTSQLLRRVQNSSAPGFIMGTEVGLASRLSEESGGRTVIAAPAHEENSCSCSECGYMKLNTLSKVKDCLVNGSGEVFVDPVLAEKARHSIERMFAFS